VVFVETMQNSVLFVIGRQNGCLSGFSITTTCSNVEYFSVKLNKFQPSPVRQTLTRETHLLLMHQYVRHVAFTMILIIWTIELEFSEVFQHFLNRDKSMIIHVGSCSEREYI